MPTLRLLILPVFVAGTMYAQSAAEEKLADAIKSPQTTVVHLWAPWCSNCQAELKTGGWTKMINENPQVNDGGLWRFDCGENSLFCRGFSPE